MPTEDPFGVAPTGASAGSLLSYTTGQASPISNPIAKTIRPNLDSRSEAPTGALDSNVTERGIITLGDGSKADRPRGDFPSSVEGVSRQSDQSKWHTTGTTAESHSGERSVGYTGVAFASVANQADRCSTTDLQQNLTPVRDQLGTDVQQSTSTLVEGSGLAASGEATTSRCSYSNTASRPHAPEHSLRPPLRGAKLKPAGVTKPTEDPKRVHSWNQILTGLDDFDVGYLVGCKKKQTTGVIG